MTELTLLKELMFKKQMNQKSVIFFTSGIFLDVSFKFQTFVFKGCHGLLIMSLSLDDIAILNINRVDYCCIFNGINKSEAANLLQNADLAEESGKL